MEPYSFLRRIRIKALTFARQVSVSEGTDSHAARSHLQQGTAKRRHYLPEVFPAVMDADVPHTPAFPL